MFDQLPKELKEYYLKHPKHVQSRMLEIRKLALEVFGISEECISYGIPTFKIGGKNIFHYGAFKNHIGWYPGAKGVEFFVSKYPNYPFSKGCIQISHQEELPLNKLIPLLEWCQRKNSRL